MVGGPQLWDMYLCDGFYRKGEWIGSASYRNLDLKAKQMGLSVFIGGSL